MAGTAVGGKVAAKTNKMKFGPDFYKRIGAMGGSKKGDELKAPKGFAANPELARTAGTKGGYISRRGKKRES